MKFVTKAATSIAAFVVMGLVSLGIQGELPSSWATPIQAGVSHQTPLVTRLIVFKLSPHGPQLSREEAEAKQREKTGTKIKGDDKLIKKANDKIKAREKFEGVRNKAKRENLNRNPRKVSKPQKRR